MSGRAAVQLGASISTPSARSRSVAPRSRTSAAAIGGASASSGFIGRSGDTTRSRGPRLSEDESRRARPDTRLAELAGELAERRALRLAGADIGQEAESLAGQSRARRRPSIELGHDGAPECEVGEA